MRETVTRITDDLTGREVEAAQEVKFAMNDEVFTLDLSGESFSALLAFGRERSGEALRAALKTKASRSSERNKKIREWAPGHGYQVSDHGRIPADVVKAYEAAHSN